MPEGFTRTKAMLSPSLILAVPPLGSFVLGDQRNRQNNHYDKEGCYVVFSLLIN